jgi:hypothetical protein
LDILLDDIGATRRRRWIVGVIFTVMEWGRFWSGSIFFLFLIFVDSGDEPEDDAVQNFPNSPQVAWKMIQKSVEIIIVYKRFSAKII